MALPDDFDGTGFARAMQQFFEDIRHLAGGRGPGRLATAIREHFGGPTHELPIVDETFPAPDHPNLQLALDDLVARSTAPQVHGLPVDVLHWSGFGLGNIANPDHRLQPPFDAIAPAYVNRAVDVDRTMPCISIGVHLVHHDGEPVAILLSVGDPHRGHGEAPGVKVEVMARTREAAVAVLDELKRIALERNVYRGKVLAFTFGEWGQFGLEFRSIPELGREDVILPASDLDAIERHAIGIGERAAQLRAAGRHVKRGLLLHGPPGTGKTHTVTYLCNRMPGRTTIILSGQAAPTLGQAAALARRLQPATLVLEDVDLIAHERTMVAMPGSTPLLFQLLNEMDGLGDDADVLFVLTTNRVDLLEPALADRPGRVDQAVEIRLPDAACRERLLRRYLRGVGDAIDDLSDAVARTEGVSAAFVKEWCRRATFVSIDEGSVDAGGTPVVSADHLHAALDDLLEHGSPTLRRLLGTAPDVR